MIRHDEEPVTDTVVTGVDDDGEPRAHARLQPIGQLRPADAPGQRDDG